jgi:hypothetical protein
MPRKAEEPTPPKRQRVPRPGKRARQLNEKYQIALAADLARRFLALVDAHYAKTLSADAEVEFVDMARKMNAGFGNDLHLRAQRQLVEVLTRAKKTLVDEQAAEKVWTLPENKREEHSVDQLLPSQAETKTQQRKAIAREMGVDVRTVRRLEPRK